VLIFFCFVFCVVPGPGSVLLAGIVLFPARAPGTTGKTGGVFSVFFSVLAPGAGLRAGSDSPAGDRRGREKGLARKSGRKGPTDRSGGGKIGSKSLFRRPPGQQIACLRASELRPTRGHAG
jgi:hypothetical protein